MIDVSKTYKTVSGKDVVLNAKSRLLHGKRIYVGLVAGLSGYRHWTEDGKVFGDKDQQLSLKVDE